MDTVSKRRRHSATSEDEELTTTAPPLSKIDNSLAIGRSKMDSLIANFTRWKALFEPEFTPEIYKHESCQIYQDIIRRVEYSTGAPSCTFEEFTEIMRSLGDPQDTWASILVSGTNGKGTVCHKCASQLAGYNVHPIGLFTSPHIATIRERFVVDGKMISCIDLISLIRAIEETMDRKFRFFQLCTLVAFVWFYMRQCRACVIEVGIGGRLDPTNVLKRPVCSIITSISKDHMEVLGATEALIAENKAGIIKEGAHAVVGPNILKEALEVLRRQIKEVGCAKTIIDVSDLSEYSTERINGIIARVAVRVFVAARLRQHELALPLSDVMPAARLQHLLANVVVDGGHNADAMAAAAAYMRKIGSRIYLGIAMSKKRGLIVCNPLIQRLKSQLVKVRYVQYTHPFRRPVARLKEDLADSKVLLSRWLTESDVEDSAENQLDVVVPELIKAADQEAGHVLFTGTFYFVGSVTRAVRARGSFFTNHTFC